MDILHWLTKGTISNVDDDLYDIESKFKNPNVRRYAKPTIKQLNRDVEARLKHQGGSGFKSSSKLEKSDYLAMVIAMFQILLPFIIVIGLVYFAVIWWLF